MKVLSKLGSIAKGAVLTAVTVAALPVAVVYQVVQTARGKKGYWNQ